MKTLLCKKTVCVLAVFVVLAVLAVGAFLWSASAPAQSGEAVPAQQPVNQNNILTNDKIQLITSNEPYSLKGAGTTEGYYYIETNSDTMMSANIRYIDYATCQDISLSANPDTEERTAYRDCRKVLCFNVAGRPFSSAFSTETVRLNLS